jgi:hypothetical protein
MTIASDFEKLGVFYLGRLWDPAARQPKPGLLLYDSKDLVTHAVCVGMTGSGKTGLCLALLEEAALDGIPALVIDPKGDIANLMLTFPDLRPEDFLPWIDEDDARRKGLAPAEHARQQAERWAKGLAEWGQDGARIRRFKDAVDVAVYTPGSEAGIPVSILDSFAAPPPAIREDGELLRERVGSTATSLLGLLGVDADPVKSREHILIATIFDAAWRDGRDLDLSGLVQAIQAPPVARVGAFDLETFYPAKDRFALALLVNNLLAAPGFAAWTTGEALDIGRMLRTPEGKPRIAICSIAHLGDAERMFTVSLILNQILAWTRSQSGTTSLRAIVYMDEIFGYVPPVANPPSKLPLLTLLKQARAFGVGVVLATQNPVDLDYKGLANAGTWFIGRLQTERDKMRVLEGLEGAAGEAGATFDRARTEELIAGLGNRIFLMRNVHDDGPEVFETRWVMSYLRGPLTRDQIKTLMAGRARAAAAPSHRAVPAAVVPAAVTSAAGVTSAAPGRPVLPPDVPQHFVPVRGTAPAGAELVYRPMLYGAADIRFADAKKGVDTAESVALMTAVTADPVPVDWARAVEAALDPSELEAAPEAGARFVELPPAGAKAKSYAAWRKELVAWLFRNRTLQLHACARLRAYSAPGESEGDFRARIGHAGREKRDQAVEQLRVKYAPKIAALQEKIRRAEQAVQRESEQASQQGMQAVISIGTTLIGAMLGRKAVSASTLGRATTAARGAGRVLKERQDIGRATETVQALQQQLAGLEEAFKAEAGRLDAASEAVVEPLETVTVRPTRQNVAVKLLALVWVPVWQDTNGQTTPAWDAPSG